MTVAYTVLQPKYVGRFLCDGSRCDALCCRKWQIRLNESAAKRMIAEDESIAARICEKDGVFTFDQDEHGRCYFLRSDNLCSMQLKYGAAYLSDVCAEYPRKTYLFPEQKAERALCLTCPLAAKSALSSEVPLAFEEVTMLSDRESYFQRLDNEPADIVNFFFDLQRQCIAILQNRRQTILERLRRMAEFLERLDESITTGDDTTIAAKDFRVPILDDKDYALGLLEFLRQHTNDDDDLTEFYMKTVSDAQGENLRDAFHRVYVEPYGYMIENYLVNEFFIELYPMHTSGSLRFNHEVFCALYAVMELFLGALATKGMTKGAEDIFDVVRWLSIRTNHFADYMDAVIDYLTDNK